MVQYSTPGVSAMIFSSSRVASSVRCREAAFGSCDPGVEIPLVLLGQKSAGDPLADHADGTGHDHQQDQADHELANEPPGELHVAVRGFAEEIVEPAVERPQGTAGLFLGLQDQGRQGRAQGQGVEGRDDDRDGDGHRKLLVELARDAGNENGGQKDSGEHQGDGDHRPGDLLHGLEGRLLGREAVLDVVLHRLHHHDGVVHHESDGEHQAHEGDRVDGKPQEGKHGEGPDQRNRHRQRRDQGRPPALQEDEHHDDDEHEGLDQGMQDLLDARAHRLGGVEGDAVLEVLREILLHLLHEPVDPVHGRDRI